MPRILGDRSKASCISRCRRSSSANTSRANKARYIALSSLEVEPDAPARAAAPPVSDLGIAPEIFNSLTFGTTATTLLRSVQAAPRCLRDRRDFKGAQLSAPALTPRRGRHPPQPPKRRPKIGIESRSGVRI